MTTDGVFTEFFDPDVFVSRERITGDPGIDPDVPLELRVEFPKTGPRRHAGADHPGPVRAGRGRLSTARVGRRS